MQNKVSNGKVSSFTNTTDEVIGGGSICAIGASGQEYVGVAIKDIAPGATEIVEIDGVFYFTKVSGAVAQGAPLYVADSASGVQVATTGSVYVGRCEEAVAEASSVVDVRINFARVAVASSASNDGGEPVAPIAEDTGEEPVT